MRQFIEHIHKSIYGPEYYQELLVRPLSFSWKYYSALALLIATFLTIVSAVPLVPLSSGALNSFPTKFFAYYPDNLEVKIEKGVVSSSVTEPYFLPIPKEFKEVGASDASASLLVIDTKTPFSLEQFGAYKSKAWLGKSQIAFADQDRSIRIERFNDQTNLTVNEPILRMFESKLQQFYKFVTPALVLMVFLGLLIGLGMNFVYLLFGALLIFLMGHLQNRGWSYRTAYRIGLHAITLPVLLTTILSLLTLPLFNFPLLYSAIMLLVVYVNFKGVAPVSTQTPSTIPPAV